MSLNSYRQNSLRTINNQSSFQAAQAKYIKHCITLLEHFNQLPQSYIQNTLLVYKKQTILLSMLNTLEFVSEDRNKDKLVKMQNLHHNNKKEAIRILRRWFNHNLTHPYPSSDIKVAMAIELNVSTKWIDNWFINERNRKWNRKRHQKVPYYDVSNNKSN